MSEESHQLRLFNPDAEAAELPPGSLTLWHRATKRERWKPVGSAPTLREIVNLMSQAGGGEFTYLPVGQEPDNKQL